MKVKVDSSQVSYPILVSIANTLACDARARRSRWVYIDDLCSRLRDQDIRESSRTIVSKVLIPIQTECNKLGLPDISSIIIKKTKGDSGDLIQPWPGWWDAYECKEGDVSFWFPKYKEARDFEQWPKSLALNIAEK